MEEILGKYFSGEASEEEINLVLEWRSATASNSKDFFEFKKIWLATRPLERENPQLLSMILGEEEEVGFKIIPIWNQKLFRFAAALIIGLGVVFAIFQQEEDLVYGQVVTELTRYELPDGSVATLHKGASISIGDFDEAREVTLSGKAFFEVERNPDMPFTVSTSGALVEVLGTSFVVNAPETSSSVEVMVSTGKVALAQNPSIFGQNAMKINLEKGEMGIVKYGEKGIKKQIIPDDNYLAWKTRVIAFKRASLEEVSRTMEDVYGVSYQFENPTLGQCNLTAKFNKKSADEVADIIAETFGFTYVISGEKILFSGKGCE